jgi:4a-hydroxytetrahydrobiopterin dehydratase
MVARPHAATGLRDEEGSQRRVRAKRDVGPEPRPDGDRDTEFLVEFAHQRIGIALPLRHLAAGQFPQSGEFGRPLTLGDQQGVAGDQCACDDDLVRHAATVYRRVMAVLTDEQVDAALPGLDGWERSEGALRRSIKFPAFLEGIDAVRRVGEHAESQDHHPDIDIRWRTVTFALVTHSEGGITDKDVAMAGDINRIVG